MKKTKFMVVAGEESGDLLAADLVKALRAEFDLLPAVRSKDYQPLTASLAPEFFGAGGDHMRATGVQTIFDLTKHSVIGLSDVIRNYVIFCRLMRRLYLVALEKEPDVIIGVDFSGFNRALAHRIRRHTRARSGWFHDWQPKLVQYVSPQVWASRPGRARQMEKDYDLVLSLFPFETEWYARRAPKLRVEFVGDPIAERYADVATRLDARLGNPPKVVMLPGSRRSELVRHLPVMIEADRILRQKIPALQTVLVLPGEPLREQAKAFIPNYVELRLGGLKETLKSADLAIACTGTVTRECAFMGVPTVALYKTSGLTYVIGKRIVTVKYLSMPNLLADEPLFPEFIQHKATPHNIAQASLELLQNEQRRLQIKRNLAEVVRSLGPPGATKRAARQIMSLLHSRISF